MNKEMIDNPYSLNIFSDASIRKRGNLYDGCYGAIAVSNNQIIDEIYRISSDTTNNNSEIKGIRAAILLAIRYQYNFSNINIFSDSQISIFGIRERFPTWRYNVKDGKLYGSADQPIKSQEVYIEIMELINQYNLTVTFWHQKGHVENKYDSLVEAQHVFCASNRIRDKVDLSLIRYISYYNDIVDKKSRSILLQTDPYKMKYTSPLIFYPANYYSLLDEYNKQNLGGNPYERIKK